MILHTDGIHDKNKMMYASNKKYTGRVRVWRISGFCGYGDSVGIPTGFSVGIPTCFSVGMGWVWALKFNPHGSPGKHSPTASDMATTVLGNF